MAGTDPPLKYICRQKDGFGKIHGFSKPGFYRNRLLFHITSKNPLYPTLYASKIILFFTPDLHFSFQGHNRYDSHSA